jgi:small GTP-binding protein
LEEIAVSDEDEGIMKKVIMLGDLAVGKTSLVNRYVFNVFGDDYISTIGTKVVKKKLAYKDKNMILMIWDIAGETVFNHIRKAYFRGAEAGLVVADYTRRETLDNISDWVSAFQEITKNAPVMILINKSDLEEQRAFELEDAIKLAESYNTNALSTSAKSSDNVEEAFHKITEMIFAGNEEK